ncbi:hypothetical protein ACVWYH_006001 [Bradyrhizobium sp. GM24.11]
MGHRAAVVGVVITQVLKMVLFGHASAAWAVPFIALNAITLDKAPTFAGRPRSSGLEDRIDETPVTEGPYPRPEGEKATPLCISSEL